MELEIQVELGRRLGFLTSANVLAVEDLSAGAGRMLNALRALPAND